MLMNFPFNDFSKAIIPIEMETAGDHTSKNDSDVTDNTMEVYVKKMNTFRDSIYADAKDNIMKSQQKQKKDYDKKRRKMKVCMHIVCTPLSI